VSIYNASHLSCACFRIFCRAASARVRSNSGTRACAADSYQPVCAVRCTQLAVPAVWLDKVSNSAQAQLVTKCHAQHAQQLHMSLCTSRGNSALFTVYKDQRKVRTETNCLYCHRSECALLRSKQLQKRRPSAAGSFSMQEDGGSKLSKTLLFVVAVVLFVVGSGVSLLRSSNPLGLTSGSQDTVMNSTQERECCCYYFQ
jgi:hypothetical protein